jgi:F-type H+-transporting ATPase subunit epsilon
MDTMRLTIVTPNGEIFNDKVKSVSLPGKEGEFGVLPNHSSLVSSLTVGVIEFETNTSAHAVAINWGHVKVCESAVDILVDSAVALNADDNSDIALKLEEAKKLVNSVQDANVSMAAVNAKITSFA